MGTFHRDAHALHGITVAVDLRGPRVLVGRVDTMDDDAIVLLDVDVHDERPGGPTKAEYLERAARLGTWKKHDRLVVPRAEVASVRRLAEVAAR
jgi:hypothetical protein